jgi:hypothetical protein
MLLHGALRVIVHATAGGSLNDAIPVEEARAYCEANPGLHLCSVKELHDAWAMNRYSSCQCGWVKTLDNDTVAMYPIMHGHQAGCGNVQNENGGIVYCGKPQYSDAYCCGRVGDETDANHKLIEKGATTCTCTDHPYSEGCREIRHDWRLQNVGHAKAFYWHHRRVWHQDDTNNCAITSDDIEAHDEFQWDDGKKIARVTYSPMSKRYVEGKYETFFSEAAESCYRLGMRLCNSHDLELALENGYSQCTCGWNVDGHARYPVSRDDAMTLDGCGSKSDPKAEVVDCGLHDSHNRMADTYCCHSSLALMTRRIEPRV